jgi:phage/plasmid-associated DNA primase
LQQEGLAQPPIVQEATGEYRSDLDPLNDWLSDNTIAVSVAWTPFKNLYTDYRSWAAENGLRGVLGSKSFSQRLGAHFEADKGGKGVRGFRGIGLKVGFQVQGGTSEVPPIGEVPVNSLIYSFTRENVQLQLGGGSSEVPPNDKMREAGEQVSPNLSAGLDPWDEGWQDPAEPQ